MFDEFTCALHWLVYAKMVVHDQLEYTNTSYYHIENRENTDIYGFPRMSTLPTAFGFCTHSGAKLVSVPSVAPTRGLDKYDDHLATWDCDKLLASLYKSTIAQKIYATKVREHAQLLFMIRNALFHRNWLHLPDYQLRCLTNINSISKMMRTILVDGLTPSEKREGSELRTVYAAISNHATALRRLCSTASCFKRWVELQHNDEEAHKVVLNESFAMSKCLDLTMDLIRAKHCSPRSRRTTLAHWRTT